MAGMGRMGDVIVASAVSSQWWNTEGSGGIVRWNATSNSWLPDILPDTSIELEVLQTANGDTWIQYGDDGVEVLDANGTQCWAGPPARRLICPTARRLPHGWRHGRMGRERLVRLRNRRRCVRPNHGHMVHVLDVTSTPEVYELWTDGNVLFIGATSGQGWDPDGVVIMEDSMAPKPRCSPQAGDFSNAYPISIEACDGMVWTAFFQLSVEPKSSGWTRTGSRRTWSSTGKTSGPTLDRLPWHARAQNCTLGSGRSALASSSGTWQPIRWSTNLPVQTA